MFHESLIKSEVHEWLVKINSNKDIGTHTCTVFIRIEARASIFYEWFLTRRLNESGVYLNPGIKFLLFSCPG